jgi:hypothetical protein
MPVMPVSPSCANRGLLPVGAAASDCATVRLPQRDEPRSQPGTWNGSPDDRKAEASDYRVSAEREGFEPSMDETAHTGFRDRRIQPLCHLSDGAVRG